MGAGVTAPLVGDGFATFTPGVSERRSGTTRFQHSGIKNADAQSLTNQTLTASRAYDAFGNVAASSGTMNGLLFRDGAAAGEGLAETVDPTVTEIQRRRSKSLE